MPEEEGEEADEEEDGKGLRGVEKGYGAGTHDGEGYDFHQREEGEGEVYRGHGREAEELLEGGRGDGRWWVIGKGSIYGGVAGGDRRGGMRHILGVREPRGICGTVVVISWDVALFLVLV